MIPSHIGNASIFHIPFELAAKIVTKNVSRLANMITARNSSKSPPSASAKDGFFRSLITRLTLKNNLSNISAIERKAQNNIYRESPTRSMSKPQRPLPSLPASTPDQEATRDGDIGHVYESVQASDRASFQSAEIIYQNGEQIYQRIDPIYSNSGIYGTDEPLYHNREAIDRNNADGYEGGVPLPPPPVNMATHPRNSAVPKQNRVRDLDSAPSPAQAGSKQTATIYAVIDKAAERQPNRSASTIIEQKRRGTSDVTQVLADLLEAAYKKNQDAKVTDRPPGLLNSDKETEEIRHRMRG